MNEYTLKNGSKVSVNLDAAAKKMIVAKVMEFFLEHEAFDGETIMQCDGPLIEAPTVLSEIADELKFNVEYI